MGAETRAATKLTRYGIEWTEPQTPIASEMPDGYWTPWHLAQAEIDRLRGALHQVLCASESTPVKTYQRMETIARNALNEGGE